MINGELNAAVVLEEESIQIKKMEENIRESWRAMLVSYQNPPLLQNKNSQFNHYEILKKWLQEEVVKLPYFKQVNFLLTLTDEQGNNIFHMAASLGEMAQNVFELMRLLEGRVSPTEWIKILKCKNKTGKTIADYFIEKPGLYFNFICYLTLCLNIEADRGILELLQENKYIIIAVCKNSENISSLNEFFNSIVTVLLQQNYPENEMVGLLELLAAQDADGPSVLRGYMAAKEGEELLRLLIKLVSSPRAAGKAMKLLTQYKNHLSQNLVIAFFGNKQLDLLKISAHLKKAGVSAQAIEGLIDAEHVEIYYQLSEEERLLLSLVTKLKANGIPSESLVDMFVPNSSENKSLKKMLKEEQKHGGISSGHLLLALLDSEKVTAEDREKLLPLKSQVCDSIKNLNSAQAAKMAGKGVDPNTGLGRYFWEPRGWRKTGLKRGTLEELSKLVPRSPGQ